MQSYKKPELKREVAAIEKSNKLNTPTNTNKNDLHTKFPKLTKVLNMHITKVNAIIDKEFKALGPGLLQIHFNDQKKDNVKINYVPKDYYNKHAPESEVTNFLNSIEEQSFEKFIYLCANENEQQIFLRVPRTIVKNKPEFKDQKVNSTIGVTAPEIQK